MLVRRVLSRLEHYPVIPALWQPAMLKGLTGIPAAIILLQFGSILDIGEVCTQVRADRDVAVLIHIELVKGLSGDSYAVEYVKQCGGDGIITTKPSLVEACKDVGLMSVLRVFIEDSRSLTRAIDITRKTGPSAVDVLPGPVVPEIIGELKATVSQPIIAGGLIKREEQIKHLLSIGCLAVSTSHVNLWQLNRRRMYQPRSSSSGSGSNTLRSKALMV